MTYVPASARAAVTSALWLLAIEAGIDVDVFWTMSLRDVAREIWKRRSN